MTEITPPEPDRGLIVEVVVFQHGHEVAREFCESAEEASVIVDWWNEQDGVECQVGISRFITLPTTFSSPPPTATSKDLTARTTRSEATVRGSSTISHWSTNGPGSARGGRRR